MAWYFVRRLREHLGLSLHPFADLIGCHPQTVWNWENDRAWPQSRFRDKLNALAEKYSLPHPHQHR